MEALGSDKFVHQKLNLPLSLSDNQIALFKKNAVKSLYPEYYIIKANKFDDEKVSDKLDERIYFLKNSKIPDSFTALGLKESREVLAAQTDKNITLDGKEITITKPTASNLVFTFTLSSGGSVAAGISGSYAITLSK